MRHRAHRVYGYAMMHNVMQSSSSTLLLYPVCKKGSNIVVFSTAKQNQYLHCGVGRETNG